jgi:hypothetical protein
MTTYNEEQKQNLQAFYGLLRNSRPDLLELIEAIDSTGANPRVLCRIARHLENLCNFTLWGELKCIVNNGDVVLVSNTNTEKCLEPAVIRKDEII